MSRIIIGLTGAIGAGKDTVGDILYSKLLGGVKLSFKDALVRKLAGVFDVPRTVFYDREGKDTPHPELFGHTPRHVMQTFGTDWGRKLVHPDVWVSVVERQIGMLSCNVTVTDIRFDNEARMIKDQGGVVWHVVRKDNPYDAVEGASHEAERGVTPELVDAILLNGGVCLQQLESSVKTALGKLTQR